MRFLSCIFKRSIFLCYSSSIFIESPESRKSRLLFPPELVLRTSSTTAAIGLGVQPVLSSGYHSAVPPQNGGGGSTFSAAAMVAAATATATATASVVAMQDRQDIPSQFNQVPFPFIYLKPSCFFPSTTHRRWFI